MTPERGRLEGPMATEAGRQKADEVFTAWLLCHGQSGDQARLSGLRDDYADALDAHADTATQAERARIEGGAA